MTDQELKIDILRRNAIKIAGDRGYDVTDVAEQFEEMIKDEKFMIWIMFSMDEWAGVISARIDREDEDHGE